MSVSTSFCLLEKLQDHLELCSPQFCRDAALQPEPLCCSRDAVCMLWWLACSPASVLHRERDFLFPWVPEYKAPLWFYKKLIFPGQQWVVSLSFWELLRDGCLGGEWRACRLGRLWGGEYIPACQCVGKLLGMDHTRAGVSTTSKEQTGCRHEGSWPRCTQEVKQSLRPCSPFSNILGSVKKQPASPMSLRAWLSF